MTRARQVIVDEEYDDEVGAEQECEIEHDTAQDEEVLTSCNRRVNVR